MGEGFGVWWQESDMKGQATTVGGGGHEGAAPPRVWGGVVGGGSPAVLQENGCLLPRAQFRTRSVPTRAMGYSQCGPPISSQVDTEGLRLH